MIRPFKNHLKICFLNGTIQKPFKNHLNSEFLMTFLNAFLNGFYMVFKWFFKSHPLKSHPFKSHPFKSHPIKSHPIKSHHHGTTTNSNNLGPIWETLLCMNPKPSAPQSSCHDYIPFAYERFWSPWPMTRNPRPNEPKTLGPNEP